MKNSFYKIYDYLYDIYSEEILSHRLSLGSTIWKSRFRDERRFALYQEEFIELIHEVIREFEYANNFPLRPDAKLLLISCFHHMIIKPIVFSYLEDESNITRNQLSFTIKSDLNLILTQSVEINRNNEISGHVILKQIDNLWGKLESTKFELWG